VFQFVLLSPLLLPTGKESVSLEVPEEVLEVVVQPELVPPVLVLNS